MNKHGLLTTLFEGWKQGKTPEAITQMENEIQTIIAYDQLKEKKELLAAYTGVSFRSIRYDEEQHQFYAGDQTCVIVTEEERTNDIASCIVADLGSSIFSYDFLMQQLNLPLNELKKHVTKDYLFGAIFPRDYLLACIENSCGITTFVTQMIEKKMIPRYSFLENEVKKDKYYIQLV